MIRSTGEEAALRGWAFAAAGYVEAAENGRCDSWLAEHFSWLPDASHEDVMSLLVSPAVRRRGPSSPRRTKVWRAPRGSG